MRERWLLLLAWLALGVLLAGFLGLERRELEDGERRRLAHQAGIVHDNLARHLTAINSVLGRLVRDAGSAQAGGGRGLAVDNARLRAFSEALAGVRTLNVLDANGRVTASNRSELIGQEVSWRPYFQRAQATAELQTLVVSAPFKATLGGWYLILARIVPAPDGSFGGMVMATLDPEQFVTLLQSIRYAPDMLAGLVHGDGLRFLLVNEAGAAPAPSGPADAGPMVNLAQPGSLFMQHRSSGRAQSVLLGPIVASAGVPVLAALRTVQPPDLHMDVPLVVGVARQWDVLLAGWRTRAWVVAVAWLLGGAGVAALLLSVQRRRRDAALHAQELAHQHEALEARWRAVLEATSLGVWEWRKEDGGQIYFSPAWKRLLGYGDSEIEAAAFDWRTHLHPDERAHVLHELKQHLHGDTPLYDVTHRMRHRAGHWFWVTARGRVLERDAQGQALRFVGTYGDVAEHGEHRIRLDRLAENMLGVLYQYQLEPDGSSFFPYASAGMHSIYGLSPEQLRVDAAPVFALIHPDDLHALHASIAQSQRSLQDWHAEYRVRLPGGGERWMAGQARPQRLASGGTLWHGYIRDITEAKQQALQLQETERLLQHLMQEMPIGLAMVDGQGRFYFRNRRFAAYFGYDDGEMATLEQWWTAIYPEPAYRQQVQATWAQAVARAAQGGGDIEAREYRTRAKDGSERVMAIGGLVFGNHFLATFQDRTEQQVQSELLRRLAYMDGLTDVANRRHFDQTLEAEWRRCRRSHQPLALILLDIDHFKQFNDRYGHQAGDECLRRVAAALRSGLSRSHDLVARYGGEEFVCLLPESALAGAATRAEALRQAVQALGIEHAGSPAGVVTISAGVAALVPEADSSPAALLALADERLYRAKAQGRNWVVSALAADGAGQPDPAGQDGEL